MRASCNDFRHIQCQHYKSKQMCTSFTLSWQWLSDVVPSYHRVIPELSWKGPMRITEPSSWLHTGQLKITLYDCYPNAP